jgi:hypothetical protein
MVTRSSRTVAAFGVAARVTAQLRAGTPKAGTRWVRARDHQDQGQYQFERWSPESGLDADSGPAILSKSVLKPRTRAIRACGREPPGSVQRGSIKLPRVTAATAHPPPKSVFGSARWGKNRPARSPNGQQRRSVIRSPSSAVLGPGRSAARADRRKRGRARRDQPDVRAAAPSSKSKPRASI